MWMTRVSIANPVFATMMTVGLLVVGLAAYERLPVDRDPDVDFPFVAVETLYPGASPQLVESEVTAAVETELRGLAGLKSIESTSSEGASSVQLEFELGTSSTAAATAVREKLAPLRFPREVSAPQVYRFDANDSAVIELSLTAEQRGERELSALADRVILPRLQGVPGVGRASRSGGVKQEIQILLEPAALRGLGLGVDDVVNALTRDNQSLPVGRIARGPGETLVAVEGRLRDPQAFGQLIVAERAGAPVRLTEVAQIRSADEERRSLALRDGRPVIGLSVQKARGANTIEVADGVRRALAQLQPALPAGVQLAVRSDDSEDIREGIADVQASLWEGAALTVAVVFLFLQSWRSTVITGIALPISLVGTFGALYALGVGLNMMSLMALSLSVGILVDDAIVVRENIVRHVARGASHRRAALEATEEIGLAVLATTSAIVAVFLPVAFMGGIIGQYFRDFGLTVTVAVLLSLGVSFTLDPMLSSLWPDPALRPGARVRSALTAALAVPSRALEALARPYRAALRWALLHRAVVLGLALASCVASLALVPRIGVEFVPQSESSRIQVELTVPPGSTLAYNAAKARQIEAAVRELPGVKSTSVRVESGGTTGAWITAELVDRAQRALGQPQLQEQLRARLARIGGAQISVGGRGGRPIAVRLLGTDPAVLDALAQRVAGRMRSVPGLVEIRTGRDESGGTLAVQLDRERASELGLDLAGVGSALQTLIAGRSVGSWEAPDGQRRDVVLRLPAAARTRAADLEQLPLASSKRDAQGLPRTVPLREVAKVMPAASPLEIHRRELRRETVVSANVSGRPAGDASRELETALRSLPLPEGYTLQLGGVSEDLAETWHHAGVALGLGVLFIYLILASQFASFVQPLAIMATLPLSLIGVLGALLLAGSTLNLFSMIGFLMLMGLVTKNGILLVDFIQRGLAEGKSHLDAALEAGSVRLRPIVMTTAAMICGMLPLALRSGQDQRAPMAHAVIGGLTSSALLTLVVVPVLHSLLHQAAAWARRRWPSAAHAEANAAFEPAARAG